MTQDGANSAMHCLPVGGEAVPSLRDLAKLGWDGFFVEAFEDFAREGFIPARVAVEHRMEYRLYMEAGDVAAEISGKFRHQAADRSELPAVGDWVAVRPRLREQRAIIHGLVPRKSCFSRKVPGSTIEVQILAANIETVFIVCGLDNDFNPRRIERYVVMAWESGAAPVVILAKSDVCSNVDERVAVVRAVAPGVAVHAISTWRDEGLGALLQYLREGQTVALLGSSGVGKSTLVNRLMGEDIARTQEVREHDQRGRHTTTHRQLLILPQGGIIIDTPGMRELQLWEGQDGASEGFADVETFASSCHFPDCHHREEPNCAVKHAMAEGVLSPSRWRSYLKIQQELSFLESKQVEQAQLARKRASKATTRVYQQYMRDTGRDKRQG